MSAYPYESPRKNRRVIAIIVLLLVLAVAAYALRGVFFSGPPGGHAGMHQMPPATVTVHEVAVEDIPLSFEYAGRTAGSREVEIRARVSGILRKREYTEGQAVKQGKVLFRIDPSPFEASQQAAQARLTQAERDYARATALYNEKALSEREYDAARSAHDQAQAEARTARINLNYTTVTAPITGVTSQESVSEGSLVVADSTLLTRVTQLDPLYVSFAYPDAEAVMLRQEVAEGRIVLPPGKKLTAELHFSDGSVYGQQGAVDFMDSIIDPQTGSVRARAVFPNKENSVLPGQFVRVVVKGFTHKDAVAIPDTAVMQGPQGTFVFVVNAEGNAGVAPVTLGPLMNGRRIIESGLKSGDRVIVEGMIKVRPGAPVNVAEPAPPAPEPAPETPAEGKE